MWSFAGAKMEGRTFPVEGRACRRCKDVEDCDGPRIQQTSGWLEFSTVGATVRMGVETWQQGLVMRGLEGHVKDPGWHLVGWGQYRVLSRRVTRLD